MKPDLKRTTRISVVFLATLTLFFCMFFDLSAQEICGKILKNELNVGEQITYNPQIKIFDSYGNRYLPEEIAIAPSSQTCIAGYFTIYFQDVMNDNGYGFDDQTLGPARQDVICQVAADLSAMIESNLPAGGVNLLVQSNQTAFPPGMPANALGNATSFYLIPNDANSLILDGEVWKTINGGQNSYLGVPLPFFPPGSSTYLHGFMQFNFNYDWHLDPTDNNLDGSTYDLYSVTLHELIHTLGFASLINQNGGSKLGADLFSRFDTHLQFGNGNLLLINNSAEWSYNGENSNNVTNLLTGCADINNHIDFDGDATNPQQAVHNPLIEGWNDGSNLSHFKCTESVPTPPGQCIYTNSSGNDYSMVFCGGSGPEYTRRHPNQHTVNALCDLGYKLLKNPITDLPTYGTDDTQNNPYVWHTYDDCSNECIIVGVHDNATTEFNTDFSIEPLNNDINSSGAAIIQLRLLTSGAGTFLQIGNIINFNPDDNFSGWAVMSYVPRCSNGFNGNTTFIFILIGYPPLTPCQAQGFCGENLLPPYSDFEEFQICEQVWTNLCFGSTAIPWVGFYLGAQNWNSPDLLPNLGTSNFCSTNIIDCNNINWNNNPSQKLQLLSECSSQPPCYFEGITFPVCIPISPGSSGIIRFDAATDQSCTATQPQIRLEFTDHQPIADQNVYNNPGIVSPSWFVPIVGTYPNPDVVWTTYEQYFTNVSNTEWNYLAISAYTTDYTSGNKTVILLDNFELILVSTELSITSQIQSEFLCPGQSTEIQYTICNNNSMDQLYPVDINIDLPSGLIHVPNADFPLTSVTIPANILAPNGGCITLTLEVEVSYDPAYFNEPQNIQLLINGGDCINAPPVTNSITPLPPQPFTITKSASESNPVNGTEVTYTISICKSIAPEVNNIQLTDILSPGLTNIIPNDFTLLGNELSATVGLPSSQPDVQVCQNLTFSATVDYQLTGENSITNCVEAEITNSGCEMISNCVTITDPVTDPGFTYELVECSNTMNFTSIETGTHEWKAGSTVFSSDPNPTYTFPGPGTYIITHTLNGYLVSQQTFTFVGTDPSSVTLSSSLPSSNLIDQFLLVNGTLKINNTFHMVNVDGRMASGSHILVEKDHSLSARISHFRACDDMWKGFETQAGAHLILATCTVEDAQYAVKSNGTPVGSGDPISNISLTGNSFDLNFIGVYVPRSGSGKAQSINFSLFHSNTFDCTADLKDGYNGQINGPDLPPLGSRAYAGAWVAELSEMGVGTSNSPFYNAFQNLHLGIYAERTYLSVANTQFLNIYPDPIYHNQGFGGGDGIWANAKLGSPFMLTQTGFGDEGPFSFQNCSRGILSNGVNVHLSQNNMDQMLTGISVQGCRGGDIDILDNDIAAKNFGIVLLQNDHSSTHIYVFDNDIDVGNAGGPLLNSRAGISIQDNNIPYTDAVIYDNRINTFNARFGIRLRTCAGASVLKNTVSLQGVGFAGVSLQGCNGGVLEDNDISRPTLNAISTGIQIVNSPGVNYCCNTLNRTGIGISLQGNCDSPDNFQANQFYEHNTGLLLTPENLAIQTVLGEQIHMGNRWHEDIQTIPVGAQHNGGVQIVTFSTFRVNINAPDFLPDIIIPFAGWFFPDDTPNPGCSVIPDCGLCNFSCFGGSPTDFERKLANDSLSVMAYNEVVRWTGKRSLYRKLTEAPGYISSFEGMQEFYENSADSAVGEFYHVETGKEELFDMDTAAQTELDGYLLQVELYLSQIKVKREFLINASPGDSISLVSDLNNLQFQLSLYADSLSIIIASINDGIEAGAISLEEYNNTISTLDSFEDNESAVNRLVLTPIQNGSLKFTSSEKDELMNIANQCPFIGGMAVFSARSLLAVSNDTLAFDDEELCQELEGRTASGERGRHLSGAFELFPNPANGWVTALYPAAGATDKATLRIYDLNGREVAEILLPNEARAYSFSLSHLPDGFYFCKLFINDTARGIKRLAVLH